MLAWRSPKCRFSAHKFRPRGAVNLCRANGNWAAIEIQSRMRLEQLYEDKKSNTDGWSHHGCQQQDEKRLTFHATQPRTLPLGSLNSDPSFLVACPPSPETSQHKSPFLDVSQSIGGTPGFYASHSDMIATARIWCFKRQDQCESTIAQHWF